MLAARLSVSSQTLYDLRSKGRGPRGFRVCRELQFRQSDVDAWLSRLEAADVSRHPVQESGAWRLMALGTLRRQRLTAGVAGHLDYGPATD